MNIQHFFDDDTATFTYVVWDDLTKHCAIIDSVLNYDQFSGEISFCSADEVISYIQKNELSLQWILETHIHADHLTAASYIQHKIGGKIAIGKNINAVVEYWAPVFNTDVAKLDTNFGFDLLLDDGMTLKLGGNHITVMHTPGHTPACVCYLIDQSVFVGDTLFMPDLGTARTDFPGGSAEILYESIQKIYGLPDQTVMYVGHDYPPNNSRELRFVVSIYEQKEKNILISSKTLKSEYVEARNLRDVAKPVPKLLMPSIQFNMVAGKFNSKESNGQTYLKIPLRIKDS